MTSPARRFRPACEFTIEQPPLWSPDGGRTWLQDAPLLTVNRTMRWHWRKKAALRRAWRDHSKGVAERHQAPPLGQARLELVIHVRSAGAADPQNFPSAEPVKGLIDGLVDAGIVPDDKPAFLEVLMPRVLGLEGGKPRVDVRLWPLPSSDEASAGTATLTPPEAS